MYNLAVNTRILHYPITGVQRYTLELLKRWPTGQYTLLAPGDSITGVRGHLWEQFVLPPVLKKRFLFSPSNTGPLAVKNQVVTMHDMAPLDHPEWLNPAFASWYRIVMPRLARRVKHIIAVSEYTKSRIVYHSGIAADKVSVIPNGIDSIFAPHSEEDIKAMRSRLGIPSARYVLSLGSLEPRKNLNGLFRAWRQVAERIPEDVWLVVAGGKGNKRVFQDIEFERLPPRIHLTGHVADEELPPLYAGAFVFAYLSFYEGFGLPPLEAMASGVPVVTGNCTSLPEVVGDAGLMVDPYDDTAIAEALLRMIESRELRLDLSKKAIERAMDFTWQETAIKTWNVLCTLMD